MAGKTSNAQAVHEAMTVTIPRLRMQRNAILAAAKAVLECPDYREISTHEMRNLRRAVEQCETERSL